MCKVVKANVKDGTASLFLLIKFGFGQFLIDRTHQPRLSHTSLSPLLVFVLLVLSQTFVTIQLGSDPLRLATAVCVVMGLKLYWRLVDSAAGT